jgi:hypothetical protein
MRKNVFTVAPDGNARGRWNVIEETMARAVTPFDNKDNAIDYAADLARTEMSGRVDVRNECGTIEATLDFNNSRHNR